MNPEPTATYRVQLGPGFGFDEAAGIVPYLDGLGVSHLYTSPSFQAAAGSTHGYDVADPGRVSADLGGAVAHARLCLLLKKTGLGHMIDLVPHHMAVADRRNPWWWDVLENGPSSPFAAWFDIDWEASPDRWPGKILLPFLGNHWGRLLEEGAFRVAFDGGRFTLQGPGHLFPVDPSTVGELLGKAAEACSSPLLSFLAESHARLPRPRTADDPDGKTRSRDKEILARLLDDLCRESPDARRALEGEIARLNADPDALASLMDRQHYRLAFWPLAIRELGYRRFFDIQDLAGLRMENEDVFRAVHGLPIAWFREGRVQGLRIDHPDGLREPGAYFRRLREAFPGAWIVAEKILEREEKIPPDWPVEGTTGYDFLNRAGGLFIDPAGEEPMTEFYGDFTGEETDYPRLIRTCKRLVLTELLASEVERLTALFVRVCEGHRRHRDHPRHDLREALMETAACFPVYRSYVSPSAKPVSPADGRRITGAVERAKEERPDLDPGLFRFLEDLLLLRFDGPLEEDLALRFQQLTGPAMAKGVEDTAFYRYNRLTGLNEVGGDPGLFGVSPEQFHEACADARENRPFSLLASTTHDTKRSEDVRARLALLSEIPERWAEAVRRWTGRNERHRRDGAPDRNTEYLFYQTLVGAWPIDERRMKAYMEKAAREAKAHTSWIRRDGAYEKGLADFIDRVMADEEFRGDLEGFVADLVTPGRINSLAQTLLKLTAPGIPDLYQGTELWDLGLVDPDNRRPVDFDRRRRLLDELPGLSPEDILSRSDEGLPKLWVIRQALNLRRRQPRYFGPEGDYRPLAARGPRAAHAVAFLRGDGAVTIVPRLVLGLGGDWAGTALELPVGRWFNVLTGDKQASGTVPIREILARFPVGLLERKETGP